MGFNFTSLHDKLPRKVSNLQTAFRNYIYNVFMANNINITVEMYLVLRCLWEKDGRNQQEIADLLYRDKASLTNLLDNLEKRKLVKRQQNQLDKRSKNIVLTTEGQKLKEKVMPIIMEVLDRIESNVDEEELATTLKVLDELYKKFR